LICSGLTRIQANGLYVEALQAGDPEALQRLCTEDLFFLLTVACKRKDIDKDWLYERCREVEASPDGYLDLWARDHYKSTIITFGMTIKDILNDPDITVGIFSHTRPIAKGFLNQIKQELQTNTFLKNLFPDVLYTDPESESPSWSLDGGIQVKRKTNPKEKTVEAWGLVDGQPTSKHFALRVYDDVVTRESVTTPEQIQKTTAAWELSLDLGSSSNARERYIGTRYHQHDTWKVIMDRGSVIPRVKAATDNGKMDGNPVFLSREALAKKRRDQGPYTFSCQQLQNPVADNAMGFKKDWLKFYQTIDSTDGWNIFLIVDPANKKKKTNDYTVMAVVGLAPDQNYYLLDGIRDRLNLTQRAEKLFELHLKWQPSVAYEEYGMQADVEHIEYVMEHRNYRFNILRVGGNTPKEDRIGKLIPIFEQKRFWLPQNLWFFTADGKRVDFVASLLSDEYESFPVSTHDDMLDCIARILDPKLDAKFPIAKPKPPKNPYYVGGSDSWMG
jgi:phage terminase large subunit-like protein